MAKTNLDAETIERANQAAVRFARAVAVASGAQCPACDGRDTEDNGRSEYRCVSCDHRWGHDHGERYGF